MSSADGEPSLREGEQLPKLNRTVGAIEESEDIDTEDDYRQVIFRNSNARLSEFGMSLVKIGQRIIVAPNGGRQTVDLHD